MYFIIFFYVFVFTFQQGASQYPCEDEFYLCNCECIAKNLPCENKCKLGHYFCPEEGICVSDEQLCAGNCSDDLILCENDGNPQCLLESFDTWTCDGKCLSVYTPCNNTCYYDDYYDDLTLVQLESGAQECMHDGYYSKRFWSCEGKNYTYQFDCNGKCQHVNIPCGQKCQFPAYRLCANETIQSCTKVEEPCYLDKEPCLDNYFLLNDEKCQKIDSSYYMCNGRYQVDEKPCDGSCPSDRWPCEKTCQSSLGNYFECIYKNKQCSGVCPPNYKTCGSIDCKGIDEEYWTCDDSCIRFETPCHSQCLEDRWYCNSTNSCNKKDESCDDRCLNEDEWDCLGKCRPKEDPCYGSCPDGYWKCHSECRTLDVPCYNECPDEYCLVDGVCKKCEDNSGTKLECFSLQLIFLFLFSVFL